MGVKVDAETFNTAIQATVIGFFVLGSIVWPLSYWLGKRSGRTNFRSIRSDSAGEQLTERHTPLCCHSHANTNEH